MPNIGIVDFGAGNIASVYKAFDYIGQEPQFVQTADDLHSYDRLVLPGVGAAGNSIKTLKERELDLALIEEIKNNKKPFLGICVGMQLLASDLYEFGHSTGLSVVPGKVISLRQLGIKNRPVPHTGWSDLQLLNEKYDLDRVLGRHKQFYFCHSYTFVPDEEKDRIANASYGGLDLAAIVGNQNIFAVQFHPEKSQLAGKKLIEWFADWEPENV